MTNSKPTLMDYVALLLLRLAKMKRVSFRSTKNEDYSAFYEDFFEEKDVEAYEQDKRMKVRRETLKEFFEHNCPREAVFLDIGCGIGDVLADVVHQFDFRCYGIDYSQSNVAISAKRLGDKAEIVQGNIYELPYETGSIDVAICLEVLEHIEDDERAITEIARVLKPGGKLVAAVPYTYYWPQYKKLLGHFRHYSRKSFSGKLLSNGFGQITHYLPNFHNWHQAYTRRYTFIRAQHILFNRFMGRPSLYSFKRPWNKKPLLQSLWENLEPLRMRDSRLDYSKEDKSTFLVAEK